MKNEFKVEVFDAKCGDTNYDLSVDFPTYKEAVDYVRKVAKVCTDGEYIFIYVPKNDGCSSYYRREDWCGGKHDQWLDADVY